MTDPNKPAATVSGKLALAIIFVGTLLIAGLVALLASAGRDGGRAKPPPEPTNVVPAASSVSPLTLGFVRRGVPT